jgi:molybdopterin-binding protein
VLVGVIPNLDKIPKGNQMKVKIIKIGTIEFKVNINGTQISTISTNSVENLTLTNVNAIKAIVGS